MLATFFKTFTCPAVTILLLGDLTVIEFALFLVPLTTSNSSLNVSFIDFGITVMILFAAGELFKSSICADAGEPEITRTPIIVKAVNKPLISRNLPTHPSTIDGDGGTVQVISVF